MKRKLLFALIMALIAVQTAFSVPALREKFPYTQPDGSVIWLIRYGDEHFHWTTDVNGQFMELGDDGFYHSTTWDALLSRKGNSPTEFLYAGRWSSYEEPFETNFGDRKVLAILVNFTDIQFTLANPRQKFDDMLNKQGYDYNGAFGSVRDYYIENSRNQYRPSFDVYGPINLSNPESYYDQNGVEYALWEAMQQMSVDFGQYDTDSDGDIDMVLLYYPGYNEAEGGAESTIWPHQGSTTRYFFKIGGKKVNRYFCTSEYRGSQGQEMCGIGTTCHEFAHALGLPDMYDTDYAANGQVSFTTGYFDLMAAGNYNDNGRRPPYLSAVERNMLGWMENMPSLSGSGSYILEPVSSNKAYMSPGNIPGEYFVYEYRSRTGWDSACPEWWPGSDQGGLLIYHVDKSSRIVPGSGKTAADLWMNTNEFNAYGGHPCYYLKSSLKSGCYYFPGYTPTPDYTPLDWDNNPCGISLSGISVDGAKASFTVENLNIHQLKGTVTAAVGGAIAGATVTLCEAAYSYAAASAGAPAYPSNAITTTTDAQGVFVFDLAGNNHTDFILSVNKDGYEAQARNVTFPLNMTSKQENFTLGASQGTLSSYGYAYISTDGDVPGLVPAGGKTVYRIAWKVDGSSMTYPTPKSSLQTGEHRYEATVTYYDGTSETLYYFYSK